MAFLATFARLRRGDSFFLVAALMAALLLPASPHGAALPPQSYEAVLLWLNAEIGAQNAQLSSQNALFASQNALLSSQNAENASHLAKVSSQNALLSSQNAKTAPENAILSSATAHCGLFQTKVAPQTPQKLAPAGLHSISAHVVARLSGLALNVWRN